MIITFFSEQIAKTGDLNADLIMRQYRLDKKAKFIKVKSIIPKIEQTEIAKELAIYTSTLQRYRRERREINMHSPYRRLQSSKTYTRKQKTSNLTEHDLKWPQNDLKWHQRIIKKICYI